MMTPWKRLFHFSEELSDRNSLKDRTQPEDIPNSGLRFIRWRDPRKLGSMQGEGLRPRRYGEQLTISEGTPESEFRYYSNPRALLDRTYGDKLPEEVSSAQDYARKHYLPWSVNAMSQQSPLYDRVHDRFPYTFDIPVSSYPESHAGYAQRLYAADFPEHGKRVHIPKNLEHLAGVAGDFSETTSGILNHELVGHGIHSLGGREGYLPARHPSHPGPNTFVFEDYMTYPETDTEELAPPASAIQQHLFRREGRRLRSPEDYDRWIRLAESSAFDRSRLPLEVQRWLNYRDAVRKDPDEERRQKRMDYLDRNMRHIIPGVVRADDSPSVSRHASEDGLWARLSKEAEEWSPEKVSREVARRVTAMIGGNKENAEKFLHGIAGTESNYGSHPQTYREGYHGGMFQIDRPAFLATQDVKSHPGLAKYHQKLLEHGIDWQNLSWEHLRVPLYSGIAARLFLLTNPKPIPATREGRSKYWKEEYNKTGKGKPEDYLKRSNPNFSALPRKNTGNVA